MTQQQQQQQQEPSGMTLCKFYFILCLSIQ